jgi:hypothetical protein
METMTSVFAAFSRVTWGSLLTKIAGVSRSRKSLAGMVPGLNEVGAPDIIPQPGSETVETLHRRLADDQSLLTLALRQLIVLAALAVRAQQAMLCKRMAAARAACLLPSLQTDVIHSFAAAWSGESILVPRPSA